jgi:hypothetical protein
MVEPVVGKDITKDDIKANDDVEDMPEEKSSDEFEDEEWN